MTFNTLSTTFMKFGISELSFKIKSDWNYALQSLKLLTSKRPKNPFLWALKVSLNVIYYNILLL